MRKRQGLLEDRKEGGQEGGRGKKNEKVRFEKIQRADHSATQVEHQQDRKVSGSIPPGANASKLPT